MKNVRETIAVIFQRFMKNVKRKDCGDIPAISEEC
jgi:hypothetical protein